MTRILTVGTSVDDCRAALALAERHDGVFAILGIHPHEAGTATEDELAALRELLAHPKAVAVGETGLDWFRDYAPRDDQRRLFAAELGLAAELGKPVVIHTRAADDDTLAALAGHEGTVVLHCFSSPHLLPTALERGWYVSFAGNATFPKAVDLRLAATQVPAERILAETDSPYLAPQPVRGKPNEPAHVVHTLAALAQARGEDAGRARSADRVQRRRMLRSVKKEYGQHFLVDRNILEVIGRLAELAPGDVVLEIGPGEGVLTRYLAERVRRVHAVEIDRALEPALDDLPENVDVVFGDALRLDLPQDATKLVANLPYNVATPLVVESLDGLPNVARWCVMVQREVADRFFAQPGTKDYGAVSVLVQLVTERTGFHAVSRTVFRPQPNVDSALVAFRRTELPADYGRVKELVTAAFAHRRKTLPNSVAQAGLATREDAAEALAAIGRPAEIRAEALAPAEFVALAEALQ